VPPSLSGPPSRPRRTAQRTRIDLSALVAQVAALFSDTARARGIILSFARPPAVHVWGNAMHLKQVVTNLLANAVKFTPAGGAVTLEVRHAAPDQERRGVQARASAEIVVRDSGPGIPEEAREQVFAPGFRLERDAEVKGSGVGLSIVSELVRMHKGTVRVGDAPGGGAELIVSLPIDLRTRAGPTLVVRDGPEARAVLEAISRGDAIEDKAAVMRALEACEAILVLPRESSS
jgi:signal transduction histidine kinase